ncbi:MAG: EVE domain-containing protein [Chloroflexi bacterium]|nr:EVE domain-containing protein [Chloroflexota bacterium]
MNYWLTVGTLKNWKETFQKGNIWGFREKQRHRWNTLQEGDVILFYAMRPVAGVIGYGTVRTKFRQTQPLWSEELDKNEVIWPLRFEFNVEHCLPPGKWETEKLTSELLRFKAGLSFRQVEASLAQEIIAKFKERPMVELEEPVSHKEIKQKLIEIGKLQNYIAEGEYPFDMGRLDVVWRRVERSVPTYVFEVNVKGDLYHDLSKLKHAFDLWNSHIFMVASNTDDAKVRHLLSGSFHEIAGRLKFINLEKVEELHRSKKHLIELEKELGIEI